MAGVLLTNMAGYVWGVPADETGINIQKLDIKADGDKMLIRNRKGTPVGRADWALKQEWSGEGFVSGTTGVDAYGIGALVTMANSSGIGGISTSAAQFVDELSVAYHGGEPAKISYKVTVYTDIANTVTQAAG